MYASAETYFYKEPILTITLSIQDIDFNEEWFPTLKERVAEEVNKYIDKEVVRREKMKNLPRHLGGTKGD